MTPSSWLRKEVFNTSIRQEDNVQQLRWICTNNAELPVAQRGMQCRRPTTKAMLDLRQWQWCWLRSNNIELPIVQRGMQRCCPTTTMTLAPCQWPLSPLALEYGKIYDFLGKGGILFIFCLGMCVCVCVCVWSLAKRVVCCKACNSNC